jgi:hypothetical protein
MNYLKQFVMTMQDGNSAEYFDELTAPKWLCEGGVATSTMDNRWFWKGHVMTLEVGQSVDTNFRTIRRLS